MKKFLSGALCATLVFSLTLSGRMTIDVDPINDRHRRMPIV